MSNYNTLKSAIQAAIKTNGNNEITGQILQDKLLSMVATLGFGYQFMGIAFPNSYPGTPDAKIFYIAYQAGTYTYMGGISVTGLCVLKYDTSWIKEDIQIAGGGVDFITEPDDLTLETVGQTNLLKFADRQYNVGTPNGLGYKILRKDLSFSEQITDANTIYEIRYEFNLNNGSHTIPSGCVLFFKGGKLTNGSLVFQNTLLSGNPNIEADFSGTLSNDKVFSKWFFVGNSTDVTEKMRSLISAGCPNVVINSGTYLVKTGANDRIELPNNICIISEIGAVVRGINENNAISAIFYANGKSNIKIIGGEFYGDVESNTDTSEGAGHGFSLMHSSNIIVKDVYIHHCFTDCCYVNDVTNALFENCRFEHAGRNGHTITCGEKIIVSNCIAVDPFRTAPTYCFGLEPNYDSDKALDIVYKNCIAHAGASGGAFYFNISKIKTNHHRISIIYDNCIGYEGAFFFGGHQDITDKLDGCIVVNSYISIDAKNSIFNTYERDADKAPLIVINNPTAINGNTTGASLNIGNLLRVSRDENPDIDNGNIIINHPNLVEAGALYKSVGTWAKMKNYVVRGGDLERLDVPALVHYAGDFPFSVLDVSAGGTFTLRHRKIVATMDGNTLNPVIRTGVPRGVDCLVEKTGSGQFTIAFTGATIYINGTAGSTSKLRTSAAYAFIRLRWVALNVAYCTEISSVSDWTFV